MIEIDLAPAPSSSSSSPSVPRGAAEDFARALDAAEGREAAPTRPRNERTEGRDDSTDRSASETAQADTESNDTESVESDSSTAGSAEEAATETENDADETPDDTVHAAEDASPATQSMPELAPDPVTIATVSGRVDGPLTDAGSSSPVEGTPADLLAETATDAPIAEVAPNAEVAPDATDADLAPVAEVAAREIPADGVAAPTGPDAGDAALIASEAATAATAASTAPDAASIDPGAPPRPTAAPVDADAMLAATMPEATGEVSPATAIAETEPAIATSPAPSTPPATTATAVPAAEAVVNAGAEIAPPTQVAVPPTATPVDPLAAADAAAAAEIDVPTPPQQIAEALRDVRRMADGSHRLSLQLHPEELGVVQLEVAVRDGQLHLRAATELDSTRRLLAASMPELREQLADAGVPAGSLEVGAETAGGDRSNHDGDGPGPTDGFEGASSTERNGVIDTATPTAPGRLDVRL